MTDYFIAPNGSDLWSGKLQTPNKAGTDGPLASLAGARDRIRRLRRTGNADGPVSVALRGGRYRIKEPVVFDQVEDNEVSYTAYGAEMPVIDGGEVIRGFRLQRLRGRSVWVVDLPEVAAGRWYFRSLFVDGERRPRPQLPEKGYYRIAGLHGADTGTGSFLQGSCTFKAAPGDMRRFHNLEDVEVLAHHFWVEERLPVKSFNPEDNLVESTRRSVFVLKKGHGPELAEYRLENVFEALNRPGEWYLDRRAGRLYYLPRPGEQRDKTVIVAPRATQYIRIEGMPEKSRYLDKLQFRGIGFEFSDWRQPPGGSVNIEPRRRPAVAYGSDAQSALTVEGAISMRGARGCVIEDCVLAHIGGYGVSLAAGCSGNRIVGNEMFDTGAGGIKLHGGDASSAPRMRTGANILTDNHIHHIGAVFKSGCGILSGHASGNVFSHNHIHHTHYTGISVGWVWGYGESVSKHNHVEYNHIHHIGMGQLSDMGGIYTLGVQPGTVLRNNLIHHVRTCQYGGWAIYPDEGSSHLVIENNVCYQTDSAVFNIHYGREIIVRNNVFALGGEGIIALGRSEDHNACTLHGNIFVSDGKPLHAPGYACRMESARYMSDYNWIIDLRASRPSGAIKDKTRYSYARLRTLGFERHSKTGDPGLRNPRRPDLGFRPDAKAVKEGFRPIDLAQVGVRPPAART